MDRKDCWSIIVNNKEIIHAHEYKARRIWRKLGKPEDNKPLHILRGMNRIEALKMKEENKKKQQAMVKE